MAFESLGIDATALAVYEAMLRHPDWGVEALAGHLLLTEDRVRTALDQLADLALLRASLEDPGELRAVSPDAGLTALLRSQEAELARRTHEVAVDHAALARMVSDLIAPPVTDGNGHSQTTLVGLDAAQTRVEHLAATARHTYLSMMPGVAEWEQSIAIRRPLDEAALKRGVTIRTLYQDSIRNSRTRLEYAGWLADLGGEVRTRPLLPLPMLITDGTTAIVPLHPGKSFQGAIQVSAPGIVAALVALFEQTWEQAVAFKPEWPAASDGGPTGVERSLLGLLADGLTDEAAAKRLGVSLRTERRMIALLMARLTAHSRFAAGVQAVRRGWLW